MEDTAEILYDTGFFLPEHVKKPDDFSARKSGDIKRGSPRHSEAEGNQDMAMKDAINRH